MNLNEMRGRCREDLMDTDPGRQALFPSPRERNKSPLLG